jgi:Ca2+-transporting ATPase
MKKNHLLTHERRSLIAPTDSVTAEAIARKIGLVDGKARVVTGEDMGHLSDAQLCQILHKKSGLVFARVMPEQKLRLVQAYIAMGHIVCVPIAFWGYWKAWQE